MRFVRACLVTLGCVCSMGWAEDAGSTAIDPASVTAMAIEPPVIQLDHARSAVRVLVTGMVQGRPVDLSDRATLAMANAAVARLTPEGDVVPVSDGEGTLVATFGSLAAVAPIRVSGAAQPRPVSFLNEIEPILSKLTCNSGGCHGKSGGQNGFRLSLLGFQPEQDYDTIVREGRGRRVFPASAGHSLIVRKATGSLPHAGGKRMTAGDANHQMLVTWIEQGMPFGKDDPKVVNIEVLPTHRVLARQTSQRLRVVATYGDGRVEDVTRQVQFQSNDDSVARVDEKGRVTTFDQSGEAAVMGRYMGQVAVFRATVPLGKPMPASIDFAASNAVDQWTSRKWADLGLVPSRRSTDHEFIRRLTIDLCGRVPTTAEVKAFVESVEPNKRELLVDRLLASGDYADYMALKWGALLQNKRAGKPDYTTGTHAMSLWLKDAFARDLRYDHFTRAILTASGTVESNPPVAWYRQVRTPQQNVDNVTQLFLGTRLQCAQCHHHPFEKWGQDDYYSLAAFFARVGRKPFEAAPSGEPSEAVFVARSGRMEHPGTQREMKPAGLGAPAIEVPAGDDPRRRLVDWMIAPENPYFARALVNRTWGHFFGRGIVEPIDDLRVTNPPSNPELLDGLSAQFVADGYSIKRLIRSIVLSGTYQLASEPNEFNKHDAQNFARYYPKRLPAEVLLDAIDAMTGVRTDFSFPEEMTAVDLPDEQVNSYFLDIFGRPQRSSSCECERTSSANLSQALHLLNSPEIQSKLAADTGRAARLASDERPEDQKINELYLSFFARLPTVEELKVALDYVTGRPNKREAYQNLLWALINTKEFQFNI